MMKFMRYKTSWLTKEWFYKHRMKGYAWEDARTCMEWPRHSDRAWPLASDNWNIQPISYGCFDVWPLNSFEVTVVESILSINLG